MWNPYDFTGKQVIVTGGTSGIGKDAAIKLSEQGAILCLLGRNESALKSTISLLSGSGHKYYVKDLNDCNGYKEIFDDIVADGNRINGLVHCAGIAKILPLNSLNIKQMEESMTVNFYSFVEMVKLISKKKYHDNTSIVGISSLAVELPQKCQGLYAATKAAMDTMAKALALELADKNIRINTIMPGTVKTPMVDDFFEMLTQVQQERMLEKPILGITDPEDITNVIMFLLSDASRVITGRAIYADGGFLNL